MGVHTHLYIPVVYYFLFCLRSNSATRVTTPVSARVPGDAPLCRESPDSPRRPTDERRERTRQPETTTRDRGARGGARVSGHYG